MNPAISHIPCRKAKVQHQSDYDNTDFFAQDPSFCHPIPPLQKNSIQLLYKRYLLSAICDFLKTNKDKLLIIICRIALNQTKCPRNTVISLFGIDFMRFYHFRCYFSSFSIPIGIVLTNFFLFRCQPPLFQPKIASEITILRNLDAIA